MKEILTIILSNKKISFGIPDNQNELKQMFDLRTQVYIYEKRYITNKENDIDIHDINKTCTYFIASVENKVIGTIRLINEEILPIQKDYFDFDIPEEFKNVDNKKIVEVGRIVSRPYKIFDESLPRGLVILGLFYAATLYAQDNNLIGGYGAIKLYIYKKFKKLHIPMKLIKNYTLKFDPQNSVDPLNNFFKKDDPVIPVYFLLTDVSKYFDFIFNKSGLFYKKEKYTYYLNNMWKIKFIFAKLKLFLYKNKFTYDIRRN